MVGFLIDLLRYEALFVRYFAVLICFVWQTAWAGPEVMFLPEVVAIPEVVAGDSTRANVVVTNVGDQVLRVLGISFAQGHKSKFDPIPAVFDLAPRDSTTIEVIFRPVSGGMYTDALILKTNKTFDDRSQPIPAVAMTGRVVSPEIALSINRLTFASPGIGKPVTGKVQVNNRGADVLRATRAFIADPRLSVDMGVFDVDASGSKTLTITYTPDSSRGRVDSLFIESNDWDEPRAHVVLDVFGTPRGEGRARLSVAQLDSVAFPVVGDTVSVDVLLHTNRDSVGGIEVYVGYNPNFFKSARPDSPYVRKGLTRDSLQVVKNTIVTVGPTRHAVYLSALPSVQRRTLPDGIVAHLKFVVVAPLVGQTRLRTLTDITRLNSQFSTPGGRVFTLPGSGGLVFGNTPPVFRTLPLIQTQEDRATSLRLASLATDAESPAAEWQWTFDEPTGLIGLSIVPQSTGREIHFSLPANGWGTYPIFSTVTDPAGTADTTAIILQVSQVNDPPDLPELLSPANGADQLGTPVTFLWRGTDLDRDDALTFTLRLGRDSLSLPVVESGLRDSAFVLSDLENGATYYWRISARDKAGAITRSGIHTFSMAGILDQGFTDAGDLTGDRMVGFADFVVFAQAFGKTKGQSGFVARADIDQDDRIGFTDFVIFVRLFGIDYTSL